MHTASFVEDYLQQFSRLFYYGYILAAQMSLCDVQCSKCYNNAIGSAWAFDKLEFYPTNTGGRFLRAPCTNPSCKWGCDLTTVARICNSRALRQEPQVEEAVDEVANQAVVIDLTYAIVSKGYCMNEAPMQLASAVRVFGVHRKHIIGVDKFAYLCRQQFMSTTIKCLIVTTDLCPLMSSSDATW